MAIAPVRLKTLAGRQFDRRAVQRDISFRGFRSFLFGSNIDTLRKISLERYAAFMELLGIVGRHFAANYDTDGKLAALALPGLAELRRIKIGKILGSPAAMEIVKSRCVTAKGVDLTILPWIYDTQVPKDDPSAFPRLRK